MEKRFYDEQPLPFETVVSIGVMTTVIRLNIAESDGAGQGAWQCDEIELSHREPLTEADYGRVVACIVRSRYTADDIEAIQLNYMESKTAEHKAEFAALKAWRETAKGIAREVLNIS